MRRSRYSMQNNFIICFRARETLRGQNRVCTMFGKQKIRPAPCFREFCIATEFNQHLLQ